MTTLPEAKRDLFDRLEALGVDTRKLRENPVWRRLSGRAYRACNALGAFAHEAELTGDSRQAHIFRTFEGELRERIANEIADAFTRGDAP